MDREVASTSPEARAELGSRAATQLRTQVPADASRQPQSRVGTHTGGARNKARPAGPKPGYRVRACVLEYMIQVAFAIRPDGTRGAPTRLEFCSAAASRHVELSITRCDAYVVTSQHL